MSAKEGPAPAMGKSVAWTAESPAGPLDITINLVKPEKDPRAIAAAAQSATTGGETCDLCWVPSDGRGRAAHLLASGGIVNEATLGGEPWAWWYSPYGYFPEHVIVASRAHRPMVIEHGTIARLLDFSDQFPAWFIGSNADLPIVGGSLLAHDHFQGGRPDFPLMRALIAHPFALSGLEAVEAGIVRWPASVMRLRSTDRGQIYEGACRIMDAWRSFSDEDCGIIAFTRESGEGSAAEDESPLRLVWRSECGGRAEARPYKGHPCDSPPDDSVVNDGTANGDMTTVPHNTLNPILHREGDTYVMDLVLRNNRTTSERPFGLFHPDESLFHIKKENIGLIEIMGRAILPARLAAELPAIKDECSRAFYQILVATGVFKDDEVGRAGWDRFLATL